MSNTVVNSSWRGISYAIAAATLFGASTPIVKLWFDQVHPWILSGLFGLGSSLGLSVLYLVNQRNQTRFSASPLRGRDWIWFSCSTIVGGMIAPILLLIGLANSSAAVASLLLNLEAVFASLIAWFIFREKFDRRIAWGIGAIVAGCSLISSTQSVNLNPSWGALAIMGSSLAWAIDSNLTQQIVQRDVFQIILLKSGIAGIANLAIAHLVGASLPDLSTSISASAIGIVNYGISLVFYVAALRAIGTSRTAAYFSSAPFAGAAIAVFLLGDPLTLQLVVATGLMALGVLLCISDQIKSDQRK